MPQPSPGPSTSNNRSPIQQLAFTWPIETGTGWGVYGLNLALQLVRRAITAVPIYPVWWNTLTAEQRTALAQVEKTQQQLAAFFAANPVRKLNTACPLLIDLGNEMVATKLDYEVVGTRNIGVIFFDRSTISPQSVEKARSFDRMIAGSTWNADVLRAHGLKNVSVVLQGIDPALFHPGPRRRPADNRFIIFTGGKLEFRKGQDIVVAAMRIFQRRHPDAILAFAWNNLWPATMNGIEHGGLVRGIPQVLPDGNIDFASWLRQQGVCSFIDLGRPRNWEVAVLLREVDVAIFPNRCEPGTNLVAMECMACGVPTILSANTGHLDIITDQTCFPLRAQGKVQPTGLCPLVEGWGESSVDELVETLEQVYVDREEAKRRGAAGAEEMRKLSWERQIGVLLEEIGS